MEKGRVGISGRSLEVTGRKGYSRVWEGVSGKYHTDSGATAVCVGVEVYVDESEDWDCGENGEQDWEVHFENCTWYLTVDLRG